MAGRIIEVIWNRNQVFIFFYFISIYFSSYKQLRSHDYRFFPFLELLRVKFDSKYWPRQYFLKKISPLQKKEKKNQNVFWLHSLWITAPAIFHAFRTKSDFKNRSESSPFGFETRLKWFKIEIYYRRVSVATHFMQS